MIRRLRIFLSSPGDVVATREIAALTIERLAQDYARFFRIEPYLWEYEAMVASGHFQDSIEPPSAFDIVVLIVWSRLGTPLPERTKVHEYPRAQFVAGRDHGRNALLDELAQMFFECGSKLRAARELGIRAETSSLVGEVPGPEPIELPEALARDGMMQQVADAYLTVRDKGRQGPPTWLEETGDSN